MALTDLQKKWAQEYIIDFNACRAAAAVGLSKCTAGRLTGDGNVMRYAAQLVEEMNRSSAVKAGYVRARLVQIDMLDVGDLLDDDNNILPIKQWPRAWRTSVSGLDFGELVAAAKDPERLTQLIKKIKMPDKLKNLELLGKHVDVGAWEKDGNGGTQEAPPLNISFNVTPPRADVQVTRGKPKSK